WLPARIHRRRPRRLVEAIAARWTGELRASHASLLIDRHAQLDRRLDALIARHRGISRNQRHEQLRRPDLGDLDRSRRRVLQYLRDHGMRLWRRDENGLRRGCTQW